MRLMRPSPRLLSGYVLSRRMREAGIQRRAGVVRDALRTLAAARVTVRGEENLRTRSARGALLRLHRQGRGLLDLAGEARPRRLRLPQSRRSSKACSLLVLRALHRPDPRREGARPLRVRSTCVCQSPPRPSCNESRERSARRHTCRSQPRQDTLQARAPLRREEHVLQTRRDSAVPSVSSGRDEAQEEVVRFG